MLQEAQGPGHEEEVLLGWVSAPNFVRERLQLCLEANGQDLWALPSCNGIRLLGDELLLSTDDSP